MNVTNIYDRLTSEPVEKLEPKQHDHKISIFVEKVENQVGKTRITPVAWETKFDKSMSKY